ELGQEHGAVVRPSQKLAKVVAIVYHLALPLSPGVGHRGHSGPYSKRFGRRNVIERGSGLGSDESPHSIAMRPLDRLKERRRSALPPSHPKEQWVSPPSAVRRRSSIPLSAGG